MSWVDFSSSGNEVADRVLVCISNSQHAFECFDLVFVKGVPHGEGEGLTVTSSYYSSRGQKQKVQD